MKGNVALALHSHLPFVKHPDHENFLEEHWLFEAIIESYLPLLMNLDRLQKEGVKTKITISLTPTLCEMLADFGLQEKFAAHLDKLVELSCKECVRLDKDPVFHNVAYFYRDRLENIKRFYVDVLGSSVLNGYRRFMQAGMIEIITCGATHGFLPLLRVNEQAVRVQLRVAVQTHEKHFGVKPRGIWLPECAYYEGVDKLAAEAGIEFFYLESHGLIYGRPTPRFGLYAPVFTPSGVAAFGRDPESSRQVWSSIGGYPGDVDYRDFYRDIGYDLDYEYVKPYICPDGTRVFTGLKYHRVTGAGEYKEVYVPQNAAAKAKEHAENFHFNRVKQVEHLSAFMDRPPIVVSPYDAELFGHWWFEGPDFIYHLFKTMDLHDDIEPILPSEYLDIYQTNQMIHPSPSSWGKDGYFDVWINPKNDWIYRHLHHMADQMQNIAARFANETSPLVCRLLDQMNRELLLAQASDWAFLITAGTAVEYATKRTETHVSNFLKLASMIDASIDETLLNDLENKNSIFQGVHFTVWN
jgi:1,4-alpha-glucan branching enzyme